MKKTLGIFVTIILTLSIIVMASASRPCAADDPPDPSSAYQQALGYLASSQNADGSWGALPERDTPLAAEALAWTFNPDYQANLDQAASFLTQAPARNADALSRKIFLGMITGASLATEEEVNYFYGCMNQDGGMGLAPGYPSSVVDTSLAAYASLADGSTDYLRDMTDYIASCQKEDGGFSLQSGGRESLFATAMANRAFSLYAFYAGMPGNNLMNAKISGAIAKTDAWLADAQHGDGGFGASGSTAYETALVLESASFARDTAIDRNAAVGFILSCQAPDGSIAGETATTALFILSSRPSLRFAQPAIVLGRDEVPQGAPLPVTFKVENRGMAPSGPLTISYETDWGTAGEVPVEDLAPGATAEIECRVPTTAGWQGRHELTASLNPEGMDLDYLDNLAAASFFITAGCNLAISPASISVSPEVPDCSQLVTVRAEVANTETVDVRDVGVSCYDGDPQEQGTKLGEMVIPYVDAARRAATSMTTSLAAGSHDIFVVIDEANAIPELSEEDNQASVRVTVAQSVSIPEPVSPAAGAVLAAAGPTFTWHSSTGGDNITYMLDVDTTPDFSSPGHLSITGIIQQPDPVSFTLPGPLADGTWYWRVRATDGVKQTAALETRSFTVDTRAPEITGMQARPEWQSPNADGIQDEGVIGFTLSETALVDIRVVDEQGGVLRVLAQGEALSVGAHSLTWDGTDEDGSVVEGEFRVMAEAADAAGNASSAECAIGVDTSPPEVSDFGLSLAAFSPNSDGMLDNVDADFTASEPGTVSLLLVGGQDQVLGTAVAEAAVDAGDSSLCWDGRVDGVPTRTEGPFELELHFNDRAGNAAPAVRAPITIDVSAPAISLPRASISQDAEKTVTVSAEIVGADRASAVFAGETKEMAMQGNTWTAVFAHPAEPGSYTVEVRAEDDAGNSSVRSDVRLVIPAALYGSTMTDTERTDFEQATSLEGFDTETFPGEVTAGLNQHTSPPDLPYSVYHAPAFEIGGRIYIFGGKSSYSFFDNAHKEVIVYDPQTNGYTYAKDMNQARFSPASAKGSDGRIYLFGGSSFDNNGYEIPIAAAEVYDPSTDTWSGLPALPTTLTRTRAACAPDGSIYIFGGYTKNVATGEGVQTDEVLRYDPVAGTYTVVAHIPIARCCHTVAAHGGLIYIMGGHNSQTVDIDLQDCWSFNPADGTFTELASLPLPFRDYQALTGPPDNLYLFGSLGDEESRLPAGRMVFRYDFQTDSWETLPMLKGGVLSRASAFTPDGVAYLFGGVYVGAYNWYSVGAAEVYDPTYAEGPELVSRAFHTGYADFGQISVTSELPARSTAFVSTRTSADGAYWTEWSAEMEAPGGKITSPPGDYFQYRLRFSTSDPYRTARVFDVSFSFNRAPSGVSAASPSLETIDDPTPEFKWGRAYDPEDDAVTYTLEVDRTPDFASPEMVRCERIANTPFDLPEGEALSDGKWYWRVRATDEKLPGPWSPTLAFEVDTTPPQALSMSAGPNPFSPDADGSDDQWNVALEASEEVRGSVTIKDEQGETVRTLPGSYLFSYEWTDLGVALDQFDNFASGPGGHLYLAGSKYYSLDGATGEAKEIPIPSGISDWYSLRSAVDMQGNLYVIDSYTGIAEVYDPQTGTWTSIADFPMKEPNRAVCDDAGELIVFGSGKDPRAIYRYDSQTYSWSRIGSLLADIEPYGTVSCGAGGKIYYCEGGIWAYDVGTDSWSMLEQPDSLYSCQGINVGYDGLALLEGSYSYDGPSMSFLFDTHTGSLEEIPYMGFTGLSSRSCYAGAPGVFYAKGYESLSALRAGEPATTSTFTWDGRDDSGNPVPDGGYSWCLEAQDIVGHALTFSGTVEVDTSIDLQIISAAPDPFSPRDPGAADTVTVTFSLGREADIEAEVYKEGNLEDPIYSISEPTTPAGENTLTWDGTSISQDANPLSSPDDWRVEDGKYLIRIKATAACGGWEEREVEVATVSTPLSIADIAVEPAVISPDGDGAGDVCTIAVNLTEDAYLSLIVCDSDGLGVARPAGDGLHAAGRVEIDWDGTYAAGGCVPNGTYSLLITAYTARGKVATARSTVEVASPPASEALVPRLALASSEPNHPGTPSRFEVDLPASAEQAALELGGENLQLARGEDGRWWCEVPDTAGTFEAVVHAVDSSGLMTSTPVELELSGYTGEHHLLITDAEDFRAGSTDAGLFGVPGWLANYQQGEQQAWQQLPQPPFQTANAFSNAAVTFDGKVYIFGWGSAVWVFDPADGTYEVAAQAPENLSMPAAAVSEGLIYVSGGGTYWDRAGNFLYAFDPVSGSFTSLAPMPELRFYDTMAAAFGRLYVLGGRNYATGEYPPEILAYDIATDTWAQAGSLPEEMMPSGVPLQSFSREGRILLIGGPRDFFETYGISPSPVWEFTPGAGWRIVALVPLPSGAAVTQTEEGDLLIAGGAAMRLDESTGSSMKILPSAYLLSLNDSGIKVLPDLNEARYYSSAAVAQGKAFVFGGMGASGYLRSVECLDLSSEAPELAAASWQSPVYDLGTVYELASVGFSGTGNPSVTLSFSEDGETFEDMAIPASGGDMASRPPARYVSFKVDFAAGTPASLGDISLSYEVPPALSPDLSITSLYADSASLEVGNGTTVWVGVRNEGASCATTSVRLYANGEQVGGDYILPYVKIPSGMEETVCFYYAGSAVGPVELTAVVDPDGKVSEASEENNTLSTMLEVVPSAIAAAVSTDKGSYGPEEDVLITSTVVNNSESSRYLSTDTYVEDSCGNYVGYVKPDSLGFLAPGEERTLENTWNSGLCYSGGYRIRVRVSQGAAEMASAAAPFAIEPVGSLALETTCDRISYSAGDRVGLRARLISEALNFAYDDLAVTGEVLAPDSSTLYSSEGTCPDLYPGDLADIPFDYQVGYGSAGIYTFRATVTCQGEAIAASEATFEVKPTSFDGTGISGSLASTPQLLEQGAPFTLDYTLSNQGNEDIDGLPVWLVIVDPETGEAVDSRSLSIDLAQSMSTQGTEGFSSAALASAEGGKVYLAVLIASFSDGAKTLGFTTLKVTPPTLDHFEFSQVAGQVAGAPFQVEAHALSAYGLDVPYSGTLNFTDTTGTLSPTQGEMVDGAFTGTFTMTKAAPANTLTLSTEGLSANTNAFEVVAGAADHLTVEAISSPQTAGVPFTLTAAAWDAWDNPAASFNEACTLTDATGSLAPTTATFTSGILSCDLAVTKATTADTVTLNAGGLSATTNAFEVIPGLADHLTLGAVPSLQTASAPFTLTASAWDANGNRATGFNEAVTITDATGTVTPASASFTSGALSTDLAVTKVTAADIITLEAGGLSVTTNTFEVVAGPADHLTLGTIASPQTAGAPFSLTASAWDAWGNLAVSFNEACTLTDTTGTITPQSSAFIDGQMSVQVSIAQAYASNVISIDAGGLVGTSNPFEVLPSGPAVDINMTLGIESQQAVPSVLVWTDTDANEALITEVLISSGNNYTIVRSDHAHGCGHPSHKAGMEDFESEMRSGKYNLFLLLSPDHPLEGHLADELRELVDGGAGLLVSDPANIQTFKEHPAKGGVIDLFGVKQKGNLPSGNYTASLSASALSPAAALTFTGKMKKLEIDDAQVLGTVSVKKGNKTETWPVLTLKQYGRGKASLVTFDFAQVATVDRGKAKTILANALGALPASGYQPDIGSSLPLSISLVNHGEDAQVKVELPLPAGVDFLWGEGAVLDQGKVVFTLSLAEGESKSLHLLLVPQQTGNFTLTASLYYQAGSNWVPYKQASIDLSITKDAAALQADLLTAINSLPVSSKDFNNRQQAYAKVISIDLAEQDPAEVEKDIEDLLKAVDDLQRITSADTTACRLLLDRLLMQEQMHWCALMGGGN